jgi:hypothetical protein
MRNFIFKVAVTTSLLASPLMAFGANTFHPDELEPCINGAVSSSGLFPTQALEDAYRKAVEQEKEAIAQEKHTQQD